MTSLFSRLLDAFIFTSAIAITAYNYFTGTLPSVNPKQQLLKQKEAPASPKPTATTTVSHINSRHISTQRRRRTQEWAEEQLLSITNKKKNTRSHSISLNTKEEINTVAKKRTQSLPVINHNKEDEVLLKIQFLIQQGEEALSSPVPLFCNKH